MCSFHEFYLSISLCLIHIYIVSCIHCIMASSYSWYSSCVCYQLVYILYVSLFIWEIHPTGALPLTPDILERALPQVQAGLVVIRPSKDQPLPCQNSPPLLHRSLKQPRTTNYENCFLPWRSKARKFCEHWWLSRRVHHSSSKSHYVQSSGIKDNPLKPQTCAKSLSEATTLHKIVMVHVIIWYKVWKDIEITLECVSLINL